jgi:flagellar hook-associated protein 3 FlgL
MMRVTLRSVTNHMEKLISDKYAELAKIQEQLSTGKQLLRPSDNPTGVANDLKLRTTTALMEQNGKNISDGFNFMQVTDTAMQSMNSIMQRLRELAVQGSTDTVGSTERRYIQQEQDQLFRQVIALVDTNYKGDYIFGGTQSKIQPFPIESSVASSAADYVGLKMSYFNAAPGGVPAVGVPAQIRNAFDNTAMTNILPGSLAISNGAVRYVEGTDYTVDYVNGTITPLNAALAVDLSDGGTFTGPNYQAGGFSLTFDRVGRGKDVFGTVVSNGGDVLREIEAGIVMPVNIAGDDLITNRSTGTDMISSMIRMGQNLIQNSRQGISDSITEIDNVLQALLSSESKNGARINRFESTQTRNEQQVMQNNSLLSNLEDVDMADAATRFSLSQTVYNAALKSAAMAIQPSLVNYL